MRDAVGQGAEQVVGAARTVDGWHEVPTGYWLSGAMTLEGSEVLVLAGQGGGQQCLLEIAEAGARPTCATPPPPAP